MMRGGRIVGGRRRTTGLGGYALAGLLAVFHGWLLWQRLVAGSLLQPLVIARWAASAVLTLALIQLWRKGLPVLRGRRAGVLWLIVALLHVGAPGGPLPDVEPGIAAMLPAALALLGFLAFAAVAAPKRREDTTPRYSWRRRSGRRRPSPGWYRVLFSRPPPVSLHS